MALSDRFVQRINDIESWLVSVRRDLHMHPETGFSEYRTSARVAEICRGFGLDVKQGVCGTGVVAVLNPRLSFPSIALRAELDGLALGDQKTVPYKSVNPGVMHPCGHDAHMAMLLGAARILSEFATTVNSRVTFIFQPAEEGPGGAKCLVNEGVLDGVDMVFGQHIDPSLDYGNVGVRRGAAMAALDKFEVKILGVGGHSGYPDKTIDSILVASHAIVALQSLVSRMTDPVENLVVNVGTITGGQKKTVVADHVVFSGSVRTFSQSLRRRVPTMMEQIIRGISETYGAEYEISYRTGYDPVVNDDSGVDVFESAATDVVGTERFHHLPPVMSSEDFSEYLKTTNGCFWWLGASNPTGNTNLHEAHFDIDERALTVGVQLLISTTLAAAVYLRREGTVNG